MEVEGVVAHPPGHGALLAGGAGLVRLTLDAQVHDVVPADGAVVNVNVYEDALATVFAYPKPTMQLHSIF